MLVIKHGEHNYQDRIRRYRRNHLGVLRCAVLEQHKNTSTYAKINLSSFAIQIVFECVNS